MKNPPTRYEPVFGGIVAILAGAVLYLVLFTWPKPRLFLVFVLGNGVFWGAAQIIGYRKARRLLGIAVPSPLLGMAFGCVSLGLLLAPAGVFFFAFVPEHPLYGLLTGAVSAILLFVGAVLGIRQGVWRATPNNRWRGP